MNRTGLALASLAVVLSTVAAAKPASNGPTAKEGELVARRTCSYCHVVADDQTAPPMLRQHTPSFRQIANESQTTGGSLKKFITTTHWDLRTLPMTMPNPMLLNNEYDQVVAYFLSLRTAPVAAAPLPRPTARNRRVEAGEELALRQCSFCHVVTSDPRYRPTLGQTIPSFQSIAEDSKNTTQSLRRFISTTHWDVHTMPMTMPGQMLKSDEIRNVSSYILSLRK